MKILLTLLLVVLTPTTVLAQDADLQIDGRGTYGLDGEVRVTASVVNAGPDDVMDVEITAAFDIATATASELPTGCSGSSIGVVCSFSEIDMPVIEVDEELVVEFVVTPSGTGDIDLSVRTSATDPDDSNNTDSLPLVPPATVDVSMDERGLQGPDGNTLIFTVANAGPDTAVGVAVAGTVTINFDDPVDAAGADALTSLRPNDDAICGRRVPDSEGTFDRWTFPVSCSVRNLDVDDEVEFRFEFQGNNAVFRLTATSDGLDTNLANNVTDGDFLNSPLEVIDPEDEGCCRTVRGGRSPAPLALLALLLLALRRRTPCVRSPI